MIIQRVRDAERDIVYEEYKDRQGEIVNGIVRRFEKGAIDRRSRPRRGRAAAEGADARARPTARATASAPT